MAKEVVASLKDVPELFLDSTSRKMIYYREQQDRAWITSFVQAGFGDPILDAVGITGIFEGIIGNDKNCNQIPKEERVERFLMGCSRVAISTATLVQQYQPALSPSDVGTYRDVGGHHIHAQKAFEGDPMYDPRDALCISDRMLSEFGVRHADITRIQRMKYDALGKSGEPHTMALDSMIAYESLVEANIPRDVARTLVIKSEETLRNVGVTQPTHVPWQ